MPIYSYLCKSCGKPHDEKRSVEQRSDPGDCPLCDTPQNSLRVYSLPLMNIGHSRNGDEIEDYQLKHL